MSRAKRETSHFEPLPNEYEDQNITMPMPIFILVVCIAGIAISFFTIWCCFHLFGECKSRGGKYQILACCYMISPGNFLALTIAENESDYRSVVWVNPTTNEITRFHKNGPITKPIKECVYENPITKKLSPLGTAERMSLEREHKTNDLSFEPEPECISMFQEASTSDSEACKHKSSDTDEEEPEREESVVLCTDIDRINYCDGIKRKNINPLPFSPIKWFRDYINKKISRMVTFEKVELSDYSDSDSDNEINYPIFTKVSDFTLPELYKLIEGVDEATICCFDKIHSGFRAACNDESEFSKLLCLYTYESVLKYEIEPEYIEHIVRNLNGDSNFYWGPYCADITQHIVTPREEICNHSLIVTRSYNLPCYINFKLPNYFSRKSFATCFVAICVLCNHAYLANANPFDCPFNESSPIASDSELFEKFFPHNLQKPDFAPWLRPWVFVRTYGTLLARQLAISSLEHDWCYSFFNPPGSDIVLEKLKISLPTFSGNFTQEHFDFGKSCPNHNVPCHPICPVVSEWKPLDLRPPPPPKSLYCVPIFEMILDMAIMCHLKNDHYDCIPGGFMEYKYRHAVNLLKHCNSLFESNCACTYLFKTKQTFRAKGCESDDIFLLFPNGQKSIFSSFNKQACFLDSCDLTLISSSHTLNPVISTIKHAWTIPSSDPLYHIDNSVACTPKEAKSFDLSCSGKLEFCKRMTVKPGFHDRQAARILKPFISNLDSMITNPCDYTGFERWAYWVGQKLNIHEEQWFLDIKITSDIAGFKPFHIYTHDPGKPKKFGCAYNHDCLGHPLIAFGIDREGNSYPIHNKIIDILKFFGPTYSFKNGEISSFKPHIFVTGGDVVIWSPHMNTRNLVALKRAYSVPTFQDCYPSSLNDRDCMHPQVPACRRSNIRVLPQKYGSRGESYAVVESDAICHVFRCVDDSICAKHLLTHTNIFFLGLDDQLNLQGIGKYKLREIRDDDFVLQSHLQHMKVENDYNIFSLIFKLLKFVFEFVCNPLDFIYSHIIDIFALFLFYFSFAKFNKHGIIITLGYWVIRLHKILLFLTS